MKTTFCLLITVVVLLYYYCSKVYSEIEFIGGLKQKPNCICSSEEKK